MSCGGRTVISTSLSGIDIRRGKPVAQFVGVTGKRMHHAEPQRRSGTIAAPGNRFRQGNVPVEAGSPFRSDPRSAISRQSAVDHRDGIAAEPQDHRGQHGNREACQVQTCGNRHRREHVRNIEMTDGDPVANIGPGRFAHQLQRDPFFFGKADLLGSDKNRAVQEWNEACKYGCQLTHDVPPISDLAASPRQVFCFGMFSLPAGRWR